MRFQTLMALIVTGSLLLAGCAGEETDTPTVDDTTDSGGGNETADPGSGDGQEGGDGGDDDSGAAGGEENTTNTPPEASLQASAVNGTAPLNVTFTLDGSDPDGDDLTWRFTVDGDERHTGAELPAEIREAFEAGNFSVTLFVSDGVSETNATQVIQVAVGDPNAGLPDPIVWVGDTGAVGIFCDPAGEGPEAGSDGYHYFDPASIAGWSYQLDPVDGGVETSWWTGADTNERGGTSGTVPAGRDNVGICPDSDVSYVEHNVNRTDYTLTLYPPGHTDAP